MKKSLLIFVGILSFSISFSQTAITLQPDALDGKDAVLWSTNPSNNYSTSQSLTIATWTNGGNLTNKRIILEFDYSSVPAGATIDNATLYLYYDETNTAESVDYHEGANEMYVQRVTEAWDDATVTWSNQPATTTLNQITTSATSTGTQDYTLNVTDLVNDMITNGNYGFLVKMVDEVNPYAIVLLSSCDHPTSANHPKLVIEYSFSSIHENEISDELSVYPNPTSGLVTIKIKENKQVKSVELYDLEGRKISNLNPTVQNQFKVDVSGCYILRVLDTEGNFYNKKITIE